MDAGTCNAGHDFSTLTLPATFLKDLLNSERISGVSNGDSKIDCRRYTELEKIGNQRNTRQGTRTVHQGTRVLFAKNRFDEIL